MALTQHGISFRYECELMIGKTVFYPDFTILNPNNGLLIYWEHLGMMDEPEYSRKALYKLNKYIEYGLIPGKNLILTFESKENPFSYAGAEAALVQLGL